MADSPIIVQPMNRLFTAADLAAFPTYLTSGDIDYELDKGRLIVRLLAGYAHAAAQARIGSELMLQGEQRGYGRCYINVGVVLSRNPDTVFGPDAAFITGSRLPVRGSPEGYLETVPELVVEILNTNEKAAELDRKVADYLAAGVRVVWVADPYSKTVVAHRDGSLPRTYQKSDMLTIDDVIPGFHLNVAEIFRQ